MLSEKTEMILQRRYDMADKLIVAIPSVAPGGLDAEASGHFGHCDVFTLVTIEDGKIGEVALQQNAAHEQGNCLAPVTILAQRNVKALIAGGMGMRPLAGFNNAGIEVYFNNGINRVDSLMGAFVQGQLPRFSQENACGGGGKPGGCGGH
jgi:predicted Fe-Mo cluster-binding NifX family protein